MSDIKVVRIHADQRAETTVTTGTKAWELFRDDADVIAARVGGQLKDLSYELADGDEVEGVAIDRPDGLDRAWLAVACVPGFDRDRLIAHMARQPDLPQPSYAWTDEIPRNDMGKVQRAQLRAAVLGAMGRA